MEFPVCLGIDPDVIVLQGHEKSMCDRYTDPGSCAQPPYICVLKAQLTGIMVEDLQKPLKKPHVKVNGPEPGGIFSVVLVSMFTIGLL